MRERGTGCDRPSRRGVSLRVAEGRTTRGGFEEVRFWTCATNRLARDERVCCTCKVCVCGSTVVIVGSLVVICAGLKGSLNRPDVCFWRGSNEGHLFCSRWPPSRSLRIHDAQKRTYPPLALALSAASPVSPACPSTTLIYLPFPMTLPLPLPLTLCAAAQKA